MSKKCKNVFGSLGILYLYRHCKLCSGNKVRILICKIYLKSQHSVILRQGHLLTNKTEKKMIPFATIRYFRWLNVFCIICRAQIYRLFLKTQCSTIFWQNYISISKITSQKWYKKYIINHQFFRVTYIILCICRTEICRHCLKTRFFPIIKAYFDQHDKSKI